MIKKISVALSVGGRRRIHNLSAVVLVIISAGLFCLGCSTAEDYEMTDEIEMGPFTFQVRGAYATTPGVGHPQIIVDFWVKNDDSDGAISFDELFNDLIDPEGNKTKGFILHPHANIVDDHGHKFQGTHNDNSARFILWEVRLRSEDEDRFEEQHKDMQPGDFKLVITNPDPQKGQPRTVSVQLR